MTLTRRVLLGRSLAAAGAAAVPGSMLLAGPAAAQADAETDALGSFVTLERAAELAYSLAIEDASLGGATAALFEEFSLHGDEHATAFAEASDQLGVDPPDTSDDPASFPSLDGFDSSAAEKELVRFMIDVELGLIEAYEEAAPTLEQPDLMRTAAQVAASHAQQLVALRLLAGDAKLIELPAASG